MNILFRFGPLMGDIYPPDRAPPLQDRKYFWRVYDKTSNQLKFFIDGQDTRKANWMRYVLPPVMDSPQNLVAYQDGDDIFFLTIRPVMMDEELFVWYCKDFARRLRLPPSCQEFMDFMDVMIRNKEAKSYASLRPDLIQRNN